MISRTRCFLALLACGWLTLHLVAAVGELPKWKEFFCYDAQYEEIRDNSPQYMVYMDGYLYFFYNHFVLRLDQPELANFITYDLIKHIVLLSKVPTYLSYNDMKGRPSLLDLDQEWVSAFIYYNDSEVREIREWWNLAVISETPVPTPGHKYPNYKLEVNKLKLNETQGVLGELSSTDAASKKLLHKERYATGFVYVNKQMWLEITYVRDWILFDYYEVNKDKINTTFRTSTFIDKLSYVPMFTTFYEVEYEQMYTDFNSFLVDVDSSRLIRMQFLNFQTGEPGSKEWDLMVKAQVISEPLALAEFFDCGVKIVHKRQFKGAFIYKYPSGRVRSFVFIDNFYYKSEDDMVQTSFRTSGPPKSIKRIQYEDFENRPYSDRLSFKYIKVWKSKFYATFNQRSTYELEFRGQDDDEKLVAKRQPDYKMHWCVGSLLTVANEDGTQWWTWCFHKTEYFLMGPQEWNFNPFGIFFLKALFEGTNVDFDGEDLEAIIWYKEYDRVVFMTEDFLMEFDRSLFVMKQGEQPQERYLALTQSGKLANYTRMRNCLFTGCPEPPYLEENSKKVERQISKGIKLGNLLLILLLLIVLSCLVWFLVRRRSTLSKELTKEKAKEKLNELKELWQRAKLPDEWKQKLGLSLSKQPAEEAAKKADQTDQKPGDNLKKSKSVKSIGSKGKWASPKLSESKTKQGAQKDKGNPV